MPPTEVRVFREANGTCPLQEWLDDIETREPDAYAKCLERIAALAEFGNELRRPMADMLRDGIRELRARKGNVHYRILYSFYGSHVAILTHGITKEDKVAGKEIDLAIARMDLIRRDPTRHTAEFEA